MSREARRPPSPALPPKREGGRERARRAARLSRLPGVTIAEAARRYGVSRTAVATARRVVEVSLDDLLMAALTRSGTVTEGLADFAGLAAWMDYVNHDGCTEDEARARVERLAQLGLIVIEGETFRVLGEWPSGD